MTDDIELSIVRRRRRASHFNAGFVTFVGIGCQPDE